MLTYETENSVISGHDDIEGNEEADKEAKLATGGENSEPHLLPPFLAKGKLPHCISAVRQSFHVVLKQRWQERWRTLPCYTRMSNINPAFPSNKCWLHTQDLTKAQTSLITQLRTGHVPLNKHLHRIKKANSPPLCTSCLLAEESTHHYLLKCQAHSHARVAMSRNWVERLNP